MEIENIGRLIYMLRGQRVMLDYDLASIYDTEVLQLKRQVRRNLERFPQDFMLTLTRAEYESLRCQFGILKRGQHSKYLPFAFTELVANKDLAERVCEIERTQTFHGKELGEHAVDIHEVFVALRQLRTPRLEITSRLKKRRRRYDNRPAILHPDASRRLK